MAQVDVVQLGKTFRQRQGNVAALRDVNLTVGAGELVVLLGASGSGKSTLLRCVAGLERPTTGRISIGSENVYDAEARVDVPPNRRNLGMVFQSYALWPHMTVRQNVDYPLRVRGERNAGSRRVEEILELVGCGHLAERYPNALSGGQQQRVALARALVAKPRLLLFDEPLSNVDALLRLELRAQIRRIHQEVGFTGLYVTHDQSEALFVGDRVAFMKDGRLEQIDVPESVHRYPATEDAAIFFGAFMLPDRWTQRLLSQMPERALRAGGEVDSVRLATRPESLTLSEASQPGAGTRIAVGDAFVRSVSYAGEWLEYELEIEGATIRARAASQGAARQQGERVRVLVEPDSLMVYERGRLASGSGAARQPGGSPS